MSYYKVTVMKTMCYKQIDQYCFLENLQTNLPVYGKHVTEAVLYIRNEKEGLLHKQGLNKGCPNGEENLDSCFTGVGIPNIDINLVYIIET